MNGERKKIESQCLQWPSILANSTTGGALKSPELKVRLGINEAPKGTHNVIVTCRSKLYLWIFSMIEIPKILIIPKCKNCKQLFTYQEYGQ